MACAHVEDYRQPWESDEHWAMRKDFILKYWNDFKEYTVLCLAQVYADVELHGWCYPIPVVRYVRVLSPEVPGTSNTQEAHEEAGQTSLENSTDNTNAVSGKRSNTEAFDVSLEKTDPGSSNTRKKLKPSDVIVSADRMSLISEQNNDSACSASNELLSSDNLHFKCTTEEDKTEPNSSLSAIQTSGIELHCDKMVESVQVQTEQNNTQRIQESSTTPRVHCFEQILCSKPQTSEEFISCNAVNKLDTVHLGNSCVPEVLKCDTMTQTSDEILPQEIMMTYLLSSKSSRDLVHQTSRNSLSLLHSVNSCDLIVRQSASGSKTPEKTLTPKINEADSVVLGRSHDSEVISLDSAAQTSGNNLLQSTTGKFDSLCFQNSCGSKILVPAGETKDNSAQTTPLQNSHGDAMSFKNIQDPNVHKLNAFHKYSELETKQNISGTVVKESSASLPVITCDDRMFQSDITPETSEVRKHSLETSLCEANSESCGFRASEFDALPRNLRDNFSDILCFIWKLRVKQLTASEMLDLISEKYNLTVEYHSEICLEEEREMFESILEIDGVIISRGKGPTKKGACREAGRLAFDKLMFLATENSSSNYYDKPCTSECKKTLTGAYEIPNLYFVDVCGDKSSVYRNGYVSQAEDLCQDAGNGTVQSSKNVHGQDLTYVGNFCGMGNLPENLKSKFVDISHFIAVAHAKKLNPVDIIYKVHDRFQVPVELQTQLCEKNHHSLYKCSLLIDAVFITQTEGETKRRARFSAATLAVNELLKFWAREGHSYSSYLRKIIPEKKFSKIKDQKKRGTKADGIEYRNSTVSSICYDASLEHSLETGNPGDAISEQRSPVTCGNSFSDPCENNVSSPLYGSCIVPSSDNQGYGFIPLNSSKEQRRSSRSNQLKRKSNKIHCGNASKFYAILDFSGITNVGGFLNILEIAADLNKVHLDFKYQEIEENKKRVEIIVGKKVFFTGTGKNKKEAKEAASKEALKILKTTAYTIKVKRDEFVICPDNPSLNVDVSDINSLPESNIGYKMLKTMGWSGGGLGRPDNKGIEKPIEATGKARTKRGLGFPEEKSSANIFSTRVEKIIVDYIHQKPISNLIFSSGFTVPQKRIITRLARRHSLRCSCLGTKKKQWIIARIPSTAKEFVNSLLHDGGHTCQYELTSPTG